MSETLEYIDKYFNGELTSPEKTAFENRCESDPVFAEDVAFYIQVRAGLKDEIREEKKKIFEQQFQELSQPKQTVTRSITRRIFPYVAAAAAACLIIFFSWQMFFKSVSPEQLADNYIGKNLQTLSITMGSTQDSLELGIGAYNNKDYKKAETIFSLLTAHSVVNAEALKYLGLVHLVTGNYDKAIDEFGSLANNKELFANPGLFYQAVTFMKRDKEGDKEKAKQNLSEVIRLDLPGKKEAEEWVKKL